VCLGVAAQDRERLVGVEVVAFHQDALCLPDDGAAADAWCRASTRRAVSRATEACRARIWQRRRR
jgi:hypothetical protein